MLFTSPVAFARVIIEVLDPAVGKFRVTYEISYADSGSTESVFARDGLLSDRRLEVESVREKNTDQELDFEVLSYEEDGEAVKGAYQIRARFRDPIPEGGTYIVVYSLILYRKSDCYLDRNGSWTIRYTTTRDALLVVPVGQTPVYCNQPVFIYERNRNTVLEQKRDPGKMLDEITGRWTSRELIFKTAAAEIEG